MTVKANPYLLFIISLFLHLLAAAQIVFPTETDHVRTVDSFKTVLKTAKEDTNKVKTLLAFGEDLVYWSEEEQPKSLPYLKQALALSEKLNSRHYQIESLLLLSVFYSRSNDHQTAVKYAKEAIAVAEKLNDYAKLSKCYNFLGGSYQFQEKYNDAIRSFNTALEMAYFTGDKKAIMGSYGQLAMFYADKDRAVYPESIRYYLMTLQIAEEIGDLETLHSALNNIALMYSQLDDYAQSLYYYKLLKEKTKTDPFLGNILGSYSGLKDFHGGINTTKEYIKKFEVQGQNNQLSSALFQLGLLHKEFAEDLFLKRQNFDPIKLNLDSALLYFNKSEAIVRDPNRKSLRVYSREYIYGSTYKLKAKLIIQKSGPPDQARNYLNLALAKLSDQLSDTTPRSFNQIKANCYVNIGEVIGMQASLMSPPERIKKYNEALKFLDTALTIGIKHGNQEAVRDAYKAKADIYRELGQYDRSFGSLKLYDEVKDSIEAAETRQKIEQMRTANAIILGTTVEKARYENTIKEMRSNFLKKEDSLAFERVLADERFNQKQKEFQLQQAELTISNNQKELNLFKFLRTQAELERELIRREEKEKALTIANQERTLQQNQLQLQKTQINLKDSQIQAQNTQRQIYMGGLTILSLIFGFAYLNFRSRQKNERMIAAERLRSEKAIASHQMAELELQSLRAQLNPHFMFNSLNAIQELILKEDTDSSHLYLSRFAELLRMLLDNANHPFITLKKELSLLELYLSLENLRIPDLNYSINIDPSIDSNTLLIPNMILQPYIENAIWHGLSHKKGERKLSIELNRKDNNIICEIEDNGIGRKKAAELKSLYRREHRSKGMELLSKRFNLLSKEYGAGIQTTIDDLYFNDSPAGTKVTISIPFSIMEGINGTYS
jgi:hypothetical protein